LAGRYCTKIKKYAWYSYHDVANPSWFNNLKIITPDISDSNNFSLDKGVTFFSKDYFYFLTHTCYSLNFDNRDLKDYLLFLGILNSKLMEFLFKKISVKLGAKGYRYITQYLEKLPIKLPSTPEEKKTADLIIKKVDEILELFKPHIVDIDAILDSKETEKLSNLPKVSFAINDNAEFEEIRVEGNKVYLNSDDFIKIEDKRTRDFVAVYLNSNLEKFAKAKEAKAIVLNIPLPKSEEVLKEIIKRGAKSHSKVKEEVAELEREINDLVYNIYGITKDERRIIEQSIS